MGKPILCLDFDGVLNSYTSGWTGADDIPDAPVPGAMEFLDNAVKHFSVTIFSSRSHQPGGIHAMQDWVERHLFEHVLSTRYAHPVHATSYTSDTMGEIDWPITKPPAMVSIDDRAITFTGQWPSVETLLAFKPWNKKA